MFAQKFNTTSPPPITFESAATASKPKAAPFGLGIVINRDDRTLAAILKVVQHGLRAMLSPPRLRALYVAFNAAA